MQNLPHLNNLVIFAAERSLVGFNNQYTTLTLYITDEMVPDGVDANRPLSL